jgi:hypothetical protein
MKTYRQMNYRVVSRPAGGSKIVVARCTDGLGHVFTYDEAHNKLSETASCGDEGAQIQGPAHEQDEICAECAAAAERWARGEDIR